MKNITEILWDESCTGLEEYLCRRWFYGNLNKTREDGEMGLDTKEEVLKLSEQRDNGIPDLRYESTGSISSPDGFGWKEYYDSDLRRYLKLGLESFKIYEK